MRARVGTGPRLAALFLGAAMLTMAGAWGQTPPQARAPAPMAPMAPAMIPAPPATATNEVVQMPSSMKTPAGPLGLQISLEGGEKPETFSTSIRILLLMTALSLAPSAMIMLTGFTRILIVLSVVRRAIGLNSAPPNQLISALALFLTLFVMRPVWEEIRKEAWLPLQAGEISDAEAWTRGAKPLHKFMMAQTGEAELRLFHDLADEAIPATPEEVDLTVLVPAFMVSELKTAFQMGFLIWLPFLIIDLVLASSLMALGMMMLPPMMIALPIKILFFVLADGWNLVIQGLVRSFL